MFTIGCCSVVWLRLGLGLGLDLVSPFLGNRRCMANILCSTRWGGGLPRVSFQARTCYDHASIELLQFLTGYVTLRCDLDL